MDDIFNLENVIFKSELVEQERDRIRYESLKTKLFCVYVLIHNNAPYYVGVSSDITKRIKDHLKCKIKRSHYKLYPFMNDNSIDDIDYYIIDYNISFDDVEFWETHYINLYKYYGFNLMNVSSIGGRGITH